MSGRVWRGPGGALDLLLSRGAHQRVQVSSFVERRAGDEVQRLGLDLRPALDVEADDALVFSDGGGGRYREVVGGGLETVSNPRVLIAPVLRLRVLLLVKLLPADHHLGPLGQGQ